MTSAEEKGGDAFTWTTEHEIHLFESMIGLKPAGVNKHFHMLRICEKFSAAVNREVPSECIWKFLATLYDMEIIDEIEGVPFPNDEKDFCLPESEYGALMKQKLKEAVCKIEEPEERSASPRNSVRSLSRASTTKDAVTKSVKKETLEKSTKKEVQKDLSTANLNASSDTPTSSRLSDKESSKTDLRRDSRDSISSNKESKTPTTIASKASSSKDSKTPKQSRNSTSDKGEESNKTKRPLRGSLIKNEELTPPSRRRRI